MRPNITSPSSSMEPRHRPDPWGFLRAQGQVPVIPPRKHRKIPREYDTDLYRLRHLVENAFLHIKRWRGIATRYAKNASSFLAAVQIRCLAIWASLL
jgi:transposase